MDRAGLLSQRDASLFLSYPAKHRCHPCSHCRSRCLNPPRRLRGRLSSGSAFLTETRSPGGFSGGFSKAGVRGRGLQAFYIGIGPAGRENQAGLWVPVWSLLQGEEGGEAWTQDQCHQVTSSYDPCGGSRVIHSRMSSAAGQEKMPVILESRRLGLHGHDLEASLGYIGCLPKDPNDHQ